MSFASPPCFAHELTSTDRGAVAIDETTARDVARWRRAERERLIARRLALPPAHRNRLAESIADELDRIVDACTDPVVSVYWPFRGEPDLRPWMRALAARDIGVALPVVEEKGCPLIFRAWRPGCRMTRGIWNIPIPADDRRLTPTVVIAPVIGFDHDCYRLGYGGGYYDRTLAGLLPRPLAVGVGDPGAGIATIYPQPHDIPMDMVVTGAGRALRRGHGR